ncbi:MAG: glycerophosphoryl diester phosphodiesterase membrane domain-containing protein [Bacillota bacterium]|nr:glycerophosphoryl diester phosphodiesterase membrane domain-containing protein [Bacillota bacterium]MDW7678165.1 glycerophosphoryl diester phosphodiesterase membrane domain-containing protein [Bacillota bacterium]
MFALMLKSFMDFRRSWRIYLAFGLFYLLATSYLFVPVLSYLFNRLLLLTGSGVLLNRDVFRMLLNYRAAAGLFFLAAIAVILIFLELGTLVIIAHKKYSHRTILLTEAFITAVHSLHRIIGFGVFYFILIMLVLFPLIELPVEPVIAGRLQPPALLMENVMETPLTRMLYWGVVAVLMYLLLRWIFALHGILLEKLSTRKAIQRSVLLTRKIRLSLLLRLLLLNLLLLGLGFAFLTVLSRLPEVTGFPITYLLNQLVVTLTGFAGWLYTLMLMPVNMIYLTRLYHQACRQSGFPETDQLRTYNFRWMEKTERVIQRLFRRRRTLLAAILSVNLAVTVYGGYSLNQELLYIGRNVSIAAHRADAVNTPENSLSAIQSALKMGAGVIEFDVQMTSDGVVVLHHDLTLQRMAGVQDRIPYLTYAEVQELEIGSAFSSAFAGEPIPTLAEALRLIHGQAEALIDVKTYGSAGEMAFQIVRALEMTDMAASSYVQSFDDELLREVRKLNPDIRIGQIMYYALGNLARLDVDFYSIQTGMLNRDLVRRAKQLNRGIWVWTPKTEEEIKEVLQFDIDGLITSNVPLAQEIMGMDLSVLPEASLGDAEH